MNYAYVSLAGFSGAVLGAWYGYWFAVYQFAKVFKESLQEEDTD